jgi:hypothetical protein
MWDVFFSSTAVEKNRAEAPKRALGLSQSRRGYGKIRVALLMFTKQK